MLEKGTKPVDIDSVTRSSFSLREPIAFLFKRRTQIWRVFLASLIFSTIGSYIGSRNYKAFSSVYIERRNPPIAMGSGRGFYVNLERKEVLNSEVDFITSRAVAEVVADGILEERAGRPPKKRPLLGRAIRAVREAVRGSLIAVGLTDRPLDERESLIRYIQSGTEAKPALLSDLITISFESPSGQESADIVNAVTDAYLEKRLELMKRPGLDEFYDEHLTRVNTLLEDLESESLQLKQNTGIISIDEQIRLKLSELSDATSELNVVQSEIVELHERIAALTKRVGGQPETVTASKIVQRNPTIVELERKRLELEAQRASELNRFKRDSQPIRDLDRSIERIKAAIEEQEPTVVDTESVTGNVVLTALQGELFRAETDLAAKQAREAAVMSQMGRIRDGLRELDVRSNRVRRLTDSIASAERIYFNYVERREEVKIEERTDPGSTNVRVVHAAAVPSRPMYPRIALISLGAAMGLFLGFGFAFALEFFDHSLCSREDIERHLELPLLGSLPDSETLRRPL